MRLPRITEKVVDNFLQKVESGKGIEAHTFYNQEKGKMLDQIVIDFEKIGGNIAKYISVIAQMRDIFNDYHYRDMYKIISLSDNINIKVEHFDVIKAFNQRLEQAINKRFFKGEGIVSANLLGTRCSIRLYSYSYVEKGYVYTLEDKDRFIKVIQKELQIYVQQLLQISLQDNALFETTININKGEENLVKIKLSFKEKELTLKNSELNTKYFSEDEKKAFEESLNNDNVKKFNKVYKEAYKRYEHFESQMPHKILWLICSVSSVIEKINKNNEFKIDDGENTCAIVDLNQTWNQESAIHKKNLIILGYGNVGLKRIQKAALAAKKMNRADVFIEALSQFKTY